MHNSPRKKAYAKKWTIPRREALDRIKLEKGCEACGYDKAAVALHFDHIDPATKVFEVGKSVKRSWSSILLEVAKCRVLCANCHSIRTAADNMYNKTYLARGTKK